jgi:hypothetical protein
VHNGDYYYDESAILHFLFASSSIPFFLSPKGVLVNLHHPLEEEDAEETHNNDNDASENSLDHHDGHGCGLVNVDALQQVIAAKWAVDVINEQSLPHELKIGKF